MMKLTMILLATVSLVQPGLSIAGDKPGDSPAKPASFVPHAHSKHHVYGSPIQPAIVGRAKRSHHKQAPVVECRDAAPGVC
jgi:hypothetical protein